MGFHTLLNMSSTVPCSPDNAGPEHLVGPDILGSSVRVTQTIISKCDPRSAYSLIFAVLCPRYFPSVAKAERNKLTH